MTSAAVDAYVGIGANLGDRAASLRAAIAAMAHLPDTALQAQSSVYESAPVDAGGGDYLNAVVLLATMLSPLELLHSLQAIEHAHGRVRTERNAPRTLDLDLLMHGDAAMATAELALPHPRLHERAFVLLPLAEIAPHLRLAGGEAAQALLQRLGPQRIARLPKP